MSLKSSLQQLQEIAEKRDEIAFNFIKQILLIASSLFAILVSLHKTGEDVSVSEKTTFITSIVFLSLGILLLAIALYAEVSNHKAMFMKWKSEVLKQLRDEDYKPKPVFGEPPKIFQYCEIVGYVSLMLSMICLAYYAILIA